MNYSDMTVAHLKEELRDRGLRVSGRKAELIARLEQHDADPDAEKESFFDRMMTDHGWLVIFALVALFFGGVWGVSKVKEALDSREFEEKKAELQKRIVNKTPLDPSFHGDYLKVGGTRIERLSVSDAGFVVIDTKGSAQTHEAKGIDCADSVCRFNGGLFEYARGFMISLKDPDGAARLQGDYLTITGSAWGLNARWIAAGSPEVATMQFAEPPREELEARGFESGSEGSKSSLLGKAIDTVNEMDEEELSNALETANKLEALTTPIKTLSRKAADAIVDNYEDEINEAGKKLFDYLGSPDD